MLFASVLPPSELRAANDKKNRKIPKMGKMKKKIPKFCFFEMKISLKGYFAALWIAAPGATAPLAPP